MTKIFFIILISSRGKIIPCINLALLIFSEGHVNCVVLMRTGIKPVSYLFEYANESEQTSIWYTSLVPKTLRVPDMTHLFCCCLRTIRSMQQSCLTSEFCSI